MRRVARGDATALAFAAAMAFFATLAPSVGASQVSSVLGIPCTTQANGVQACIGDIQHRVPSWDGVPLDVNVWLPPANQKGPFPLIAFHHGWGGNKGGAGADPSLALQGYVVMSYTARGFGNSCGSAASRLADPAGCAKGWIHLDDLRYEARDTQTLAGRLADLKLVEPKKIGVTGISYGGGISYELAALKDRIELPDGRLVPWRSPDGKRMRIAAAVPLWGWSDLAYSLMPNGNTLDYLADNPYGNRIGVQKQSYQTLLYNVGLSGFYAPSGNDPDITAWFNRINQGEPYDDAASQEQLNQVRSFHSAYYLQIGLPHKRQEKPAPILAYNSFIDDLFPADEVLRYRNQVLDRWKHATFQVLLSAGPGHPRAPLAGTTPDLAGFVPQFFTHYLKRGPALRLGVRTYTQNCGGSTMLGPFDSKTWEGQHPAEVRLDSAAPQTFTGAGGNPAVAADVDPTPASLAHAGCVSEPATPEPNTANYDLPAATGGGYTLLGSPTVIARLAVSSANAQVDARLWDVAPNGSESFVTRGVLRPAPGTNTVVFQLHPNGWHFAPGHVARLQLLGRDAPYARPSNGTFSATASNLQLRLPVHEQPNGGQVRKPLAPLDRDGTPATRRELAGS
jgi:X-Pro dipeptidyl-peptidase (S15 family)/X-Pro dipeptidyl-peptidase C-terminal non-catalytic domain